ncbi:MAG TPA: family 1 glycosylhydrolase [Candidatus Dormibacteraeota bacterium]|nr:family 1 glycosylhydrolase [Candidatus Dormibacteraeota bacterium]
MSAGLELWAGFECTVNRVGERYFDEVRRTGHDGRIADLDLAANLGARAVRYPVLWERVAREDGGYDWRWSDERLDRIRALGMRPIVGLVHHGSGPRDTDLLDPSFAERLAGYARAVAERYPWVEEFTPINEPLTTARFAALYGHWYPHAHDDRSFVRALLQQCAAIALAMSAIREITPRARLVQTEDIGWIFSTPELAYQAAFENERRWLSLDLLCGAVDERHPLSAYLRSNGAGDAELDRFRAAPCAPDVIGLNHYVTSDRFLDGRVSLYPAEAIGGNGRAAYADVTAARATAGGGLTLEASLHAAWRRYRRPLAVTEVHHGCTREEQLRWVAEIRDAVEQARAAGVDVRAITAWALLGSYDWDSLVTRDAGRYEPGVYDLRASAPRPTSLVELFRAIADGRAYDHPVLDVPGWWHRPERLHAAPVDVALPQPRATRHAAANPRAVLVVGAGGTLGRALVRIGTRRGLRIAERRHADLDAADADAVRRTLNDVRPWAVINAAGHVRVDDAERDERACRRANVDGATALAEAAAARGIRYVTFSSDLVFDGRRRSPYDEDASTNPLSVYGRTKAEAERRVSELHADALVVRTSAFFGPWDEANFVTRSLGALLRGERVVAADDLVVSPTYVPDLVNAVLDLLVDGESGIWHLANDAAITWAELARTLAALWRADAALVEARPAAALGYAAPRPPYSVLGSRRAFLLSPLDDALERYRVERAA